MTTHTNVDWWLSFSYLELIIKMFMAPMLSLYCYSEVFVTPLVYILALEVVACQEIVVLRMEELIQKIQKIQKIHAVPVMMIESI